MKRLFVVLSMGILGGCESETPPVPPPIQDVAIPVVASQMSADEKSVFEAREDSLKNLQDRHPGKTFEASIEAGPLRVRVQANGESCERQVPPGAVLGEWMTNLDHTLDRCVTDLFAGEK